MSHGTLASNRRRARRAVLIAGPTASGKSAVALAVARKLGGVVINADAMQVYRELRILTARPSIEDETDVPHRLYGHVSAAQSWSVGAWLAGAQVAVEEVWAGGATPIITGGTGLYFRALEHGLASTPAIPPAVRERWRARLAKEGAAALYQELQTRAPEEAARLKARDTQRLLRALEVLETTGWPLSRWQASNGVSVLAGAEITRTYLLPERSALKARAEARFERMIEQGALEEVRSLVGLGLAPSLPAMKAIGVPQLAAHLAGRSSLDAAIAAAKTATRQYIKRQITWWRHQMPGWPPAEDPREAVQLLCNVHVSSLDV